MTSEEYPTTKLKTQHQSQWLAILSRRPIFLRIALFDFSGFSAYTLGKREILSKTETKQEKKNDAGI
jgi:hypothetical protein